MSLPGLTDIVKAQMAKSQDPNQQLSEAQRATLNFLTPQLQAIQTQTQEEKTSSRRASITSNMGQISRRNSTDLSGNPPPKKFLNGWLREQEDLMAEWADKAACYRWLHERCEKKYSRLNMALTIPVIVLSTLTGTASFAIGSLVNDDLNTQKYAQAAIGCISLITGIISTVANFLRYAQGTESHRVAAIAWGKFQRQIAVEVAIPPGERIDCMDFLKICRAELDRLIEQSPAIPDEIIEEFEKEFEGVKDIKKPEICNGLEHTRVFQDHGSRLKHITSEIAMLVLHKKRLLRDQVLPDLKEMIDDAVKKQTDTLSSSIVTPPPNPQITLSYIEDLKRKTRQSLLPLDYYSKRVASKVISQKTPKDAGTQTIDEEKSIESEKKEEEVRVEIIGSSQ